MTKRILIAAGLVAALAGSTAVAIAEGPRGGGTQGPRVGIRGGSGADLGLHGVELTEAQRQQVRTVLEAHQADRQAIAGKLREAHRAFGEATRAAATDEAAIRARAADVAAAMADEAILRAKIRTEVHQLLTAEQQQRLQEREAQMQQRRQQRQLEWQKQRSPRQRPQ